MSATASAGFDAQSVRAAFRLADRDAAAAEMYPASVDLPETFPAVGRRLRMRRRGEVDPSVRSRSFSTTRACCCGIPGRSPRPAPVDACGAAFPRRRTES